MFFSYLPKILYKKNILVENMAYKKESWINNKRHYKRHIRNQWMHGHAARAIDGDYDQTLHRWVQRYAEKNEWNNNHDQV